MVRVDFIVTPEGRPYLIEINTIPGMSAGSIVPKQVRAAGMTLGELYLHQGQWKFNPVGNGVHMDLAGQCALYGVTLA